MSTYYNPTIVTDGLVLCLDGEDLDYSTKSVLFNEYINFYK